MEDCDVLIVGGSVAGASLAIHLGRLGLRTLLLDKARFPRRKACGEGLLPHGVHALRELGLGDPPGLRVSGIRYIAPSGDAATGRFDEADLGQGFMVHREVFDQWLLDHARATPNVEVREGVDVENVRMADDRVEAAGLRAKFVVGADGMRSIFHRLGPFRRSHPRRERHGLCTVIRGYPIGDTVDIFLSRKGEAYAGPAGRGEASLAVLLERGTSLEEFLAGVPALRDVEIVKHPIGASPLGSRVAPIVHGRALLIGDAAGVVDPISGEGMSLALITARVAAEVLHEAIKSGDPRALQRYAAERRRRMEPARRLAGLILGVSRHPWLANRAVRRLSRDPALFSRLLRAACGGSLGFLEPARLVL